MLVEAGKRTGRHAGKRLGIRRDRDDHAAADRVAAAEPKPEALNSGIWNGR